jgi:hypothetical protein
MTGLLARETLELSLLQHSVLALNALIWLTATRPGSAGILPASEAALLPAPLAGRMPALPLTAILTLSLSLWAFWGEQVCFDTQLTWQILADYPGRLITLKEIGLLGHLRSNPPFWAWYVSLIPNYAIQQLAAVMLSGLILGLCAVLYGPWLTSLIAATSPCSNSAVRSLWRGSLRWPVCCMPIHSACPGDSAAAPSPRFIRHFLTPCGAVRPGIFPDSCEVSRRCPGIPGRWQGTCRCPSSSWPV